MVQRKQQYLKKWENDSDGQTINGKDIRIGQWAKQCDKDKYSATCTVCQKNVYVGHMGKPGLIQHAATTKHLQIMTAKVAQPAFSLKVKEIKQESGDAVLSAEMRWAAFIAEHDLPANIASDSANLFASMFPDSDIAKDFRCSRTKLGYLVSDGFQPALHAELVEDMQSIPFSLLIDESNKTFENKYLHILVKYFKDGKIITKFYQSTYIKQGTADDIATSIDMCFKEDCIPWSNVIQVMSDSPNVMRGEKNGVIQPLRRRHSPHMVDIGGCSLHHVHNAVSYATSALGDDIEAFAVDVFAFFKHRAGLVQEFHDVQAVLEIAEHQLLRFVSTRWLSILPVVDRLLEQWDALTVFFENLRKTHPEVSKQDRVKRILSCLRNSVMKAKLTFLCATLPTFQAFEKLFQASDGKVHLLHLEMCELLKTSMAQFVKPELLENVRSSSALLEVKFDSIDSQLSDKALSVGQATRELLRDMSREDRKLFMLDIRKFYRVVVQKLMKYLPIECQTLQDLQFLHPEAQKEPNGLCAVRRIAKTLSSLCKEIDVDQVEKEWHRYAVEDFGSEKETAGSNVVIYWNAVLKKTYPNGERKFNNLELVVKLSLSIAHGNADTERSFSRSSRILRKQRSSLGIHSLNGYMTINSAFDATKQNSHNMILNKPRLQACREAHATYHKRTSDELRRKASKEKKLTQKAEGDALTNALKVKQDIASKQRALIDIKNEARNHQRKIDILMKEVQSELKTVQKVDKKITKQEKELEKIKNHVDIKKKRSSQSASKEPKPKQAKITDLIKKKKEDHLGTSYDKIKAAIKEREIDQIQGDGNCFFRAISKVVFGTEDSHPLVREKLVDHIMQNKGSYAMYIDGDLDNHLMSMKINSTWATQTEIFAAASMLDRDIYVLAPHGSEYKWCLFSPRITVTKSALQPACECYITICNTGGCHYDLITSANFNCNCKEKRPSLGV